MIEGIPLWAVLLDYALGVVMWTLIARFGMRLFLPEESTFFFNRFFVRATQPLIDRFRPITPAFLVPALVPLVLGVWWKRANRPGALAGMIIGLGTGWWYLLAVRNPDAWYGIAKPWIGLDDIRFGVVGVTASAIAMIVVTLLTPAPSEEVQRMVDDVRVPSGDTIIPSKA